MTIESRIQTQCDELITKYKTSAIKYYAYSSGSLDIYKQRTKTFESPVSLTGRAIHKPTREKISVIGNDEAYEIAFLFSRLEMVRKFPGIADGDWLKSSGEMEWRNRRYRIELVAPTGQIGTTFTLLVVAANSIQGARDGI